MPNIIPNFAVMQGQIDKLGRELQDALTRKAWKSTIDDLTAKRAEAQANLDRAVAGVANTPVFDEAMAALQVAQDPKRPGRPVSVGDMLAAHLTANPRVLERKAQHAEYVAGWTAEKLMTPEERRQRTISESRNAAADARSAADKASAGQWDVVAAARHQVDAYDPFAGDDDD